MWRYGRDLAADTKQLIDGHLSRSHRILHRKDDIIGTPEPKVRLGIAKVTQTLTELPFGMQRVETSALSIEIPQIPGVGSFFVLTPDLRTPPDLLMTWSTENPHP